MGEIRIENLYKAFGKTEVLKDINLDIEDGSFTVLLGPSGCGKSTLLRLLAGLDEESKGKIYMDDRDITEQEPKDRNMAMVFQNYALYPHMTVSQNIEYGLKIKKVSKKDRQKLIAEVLKLVELEDHLNKRPNQLSGGQRQRVALARAIVKRPGAFLMDEPLSNLDAKLRHHMRQELIDLHQKLNTTFLYVTHDQVEAMSMGTYIVILNKGKIMQKGTPKEIYTNPQNLFVAQFIGSPPINIIEAEGITMAIRPEKLSIMEENTVGNSEYALKGELLSTEQLGGETVYRVATKYGKMNVKTASNWNHLGRNVKLWFFGKDVLFFDENNQRMEANASHLENFRADSEMHVAYS
ncbi:ABC transporter ATP-binding protein [Gracilibacillus sp. HCP3S3_G5_1]|uniref:ABC transporter ATP-binding protein n=1 Tax=unclassified Gracilibacillus TaxID=2625209 RepID=UPI003F89B672